MSQTRDFVVFVYVPRLIESLFAGMTLRAMDSQSSLVGKIST